MHSILQLEMILPDRAYAFFSHTHKAQKENMPLLDKVKCLMIHSVVIPIDLYKYILLIDGHFK